MTGEKKANENINNVDEPSIDLPLEIKNFLAKAVIVSIAVVVSLSFLIPDLPKIPETEQNKLLLLSFVQNPYVLWRLSELEESKGKNENASKYMEAAIGLMEMHGATEKSLEKYRDRLIRLKSK
jgi:hypothetical protein